MHTLVHRTQPRNITARNTNSQNRGSIVFADKDSAPVRRWRACACRWGCVFAWNQPALCLHPDINLITSILVAGQRGTLLRRQAMAVDQARQSQSRFNTPGGHISLSADLPCPLSCMKHLLPARNTRSGFRADDAADFITLWQASCRLPRKIRKLEESFRQTKVMLLRRMLGATRMALRPAGRPVSIAAIVYIDTNSHK